MEESRTTNRWCLVVVMGRKAGHLALGIGKAAGVIVTVIPEDFAGETISMDELCLVLEGAVLKRRTFGRNDGLAVVAEGVASKMDPAELVTLSGEQVGYDAHGNIRLEKIPLAAVLERELTRRFEERGDKVSLVPVSLGYELRCAAPIPFDIDYTRTLGYGAVRFLLEDGVSDSGVVCVDDGRLKVLGFSEIEDPESGRIRTRLVDTGSEHYRVAREYMIRLRPEDLEEESALQRLADAAGMAPQEVKRRFSPVFRTDSLVAEPVKL
jgi:6-phosphofructokinase 1